MDRVKHGVYLTQGMILITSVILMFFVHFTGKYLLMAFVDPSETEVLMAGQTYFRTIVWAYPFLGSIFLYRNALQGMGYGFVPMMGGIFELIARAGVVAIVAGHTSFAGVCFTDPAAWIAALIPLIPYYYWIMKKKAKNGIS